MLPERRGVDLHTFTPAEDQARAALDLPRTNNLYELIGQRVELRAALRALLAECQERVTEEMVEAARNAYWGPGAVSFRRALETALAHRPEGTR